MYKYKGHTPGSKARAKQWLKNKRKHTRKQAQTHEQTRKSEHEKGSKQAQRKEQATNKSKALKLISVYNPIQSNKRVIL